MGVNACLILLQTPVVICLISLIRRDTISLYWPTAGNLMLYSSRKLEKKNTKKMLMNIIEKIKNIHYRLYLCIITII